MRKILLSSLAFLFVGCASVNTGSVSVVQTSRGVEISSMNSVLFDTGQYNLKPSSAELISNIAKVINTRTKANILVEGHTDSSGNASFNQDLSEMRALMVKKALIDNGVQKNRISAVGYGSTKPAYTNSSESGRSQNRRTDIILLGEKKENVDNVFLKIINAFIGG